MKIDNKLILEYSKNLTILYVEDDESLRKTTSEIFKNYFLKVDIAVDGQDGLSKFNKYYEENEVRYDLIISDINMPNMNGVEMASHILQNHYDQAIIFITAHNEVEYLQRSIDLGIDGFITKPIKLEQLKKILYKVSQSVHDRKTIQIHYEIIEKLNIDLQVKNDELEKSLRMLNTMVDKKREPLVSKYLKDSKKDILCLEKDEQNTQVDLFVNDDLEDIKEIHQEIDSNVLFIINSKDGEIKKFVDLVSRGFSEYSSILSYYTFFHDLSKSMKKFAHILSRSDLPVDKQSVYDVFVLLESFMFVLGKWSEKLQDGDSEKLNYFDASLISDMQTIITMWTMSEDMGGEIEFF